MKSYPQKILIVGGGSIGKRHARNLLALGLKDIAVADIKEERRREVEKLYDVRTFADFKSALTNSEWNAVFICTPPASHIALALEAVRNNIPVFIEKPLSYGLGGVSALTYLIKKKNIPVMVGCNLRFHPLLKEIKRMLEVKTVGTVWGARAEFGQYLPDWHSWEDYRGGYSAQKKLGGGIVLDAIHEIDYLCWLFGDVLKVRSAVEHISNLEIDTEDYAEIILKFQNGVIGEIHLDYLQREASRTLKIIGERGTITADLRVGKLSLFLAAHKKWRETSIKNFDYGKTYIDEARYFLKCVAQMQMPKVSSVDEARRALQIALNAKRKSWKN